jgi:hypothetical protein
VQCATETKNGNSLRPWITIKAKWLYKNYTTTLLK